MSASGILSGVKIVEFDGLGPIPLCAMMLADHGAEIVRIVRPGSPVTDNEVGGAILHRNRASVELDLKSPSDRARALDLVARADAALEGFRPGVMERLGLGPEACHARNPCLVYGRMTGWGQTGPLANRAGHDINYLAMSGALALMGSPDRPPSPPLNLVADYAGGTLFLAFGVIAGLLDVARGGKGHVVDAAMCDAVPVLLSLMHALRATGQWKDRRGANLLDGGRPFYRCYKCKDGGFIAVGALEPQFFRLFMHGIGLDPGAFPQDDEACWPVMTDAIAARFREKTRDEWGLLFSDGDACVSPVLGVDEAAQTLHAQARGIFRRDGDRIEATRAPRFGNETTVFEPPSRLGIDDALARWSQ
ncbi:MULTISPECIES: CaiB/BaiF CoA-transferase family protein [unclassified Chelatococcus]|uniref:CaiB/BaiF CoA transferase family protein n=1 Tax=unclassified Chelatococcus TaxID=2638111 RepID=UPI001BCAD54C|nr:MULTISPECIES: CaiB/BaiF CoA-transferase family protein [unclassified Chelatococcus]MBS7743474.1 CoA transferase [Chelatococcus sp. HY11]MBX3547086.1 CoA transferase [Chelatococcus sp.]CAH1663544.1 Alpha-methylacyl-CoA racemase [Hyphomicrobiales bacterium]CAH1687725.1 Alpha-methylacyl-CoA racemase [Hyphomicrobiales bacterium]